ncbi:MAG TPA: hypothetical protein VL485_15415 [Ktedonobacteraceae bacterium]|jgi:hypothetical protein|nr:hypothetical protein [Ktedonobacteraceae bacterium]
MSQSSSDKYVYFTVGILKESQALEALKQDALKHHMIEQPGQLIALRVTEYYEMMTQGIVQPVVRVPAIMAPVVAPEGNERNMSASSQPTPPTPLPSSPKPIPLPSTLNQPPAAHQAPTPMSQVTGKMRALRRDDPLVATSSNADQNADEAADYWSTL